MTEMKREVAISYYMEQARAGLETFGYLELAADVGMDIGQVTSAFLAIPAYMRPGVARWILFGIKPGDFLTAVIMNDLKEAAARADDQNRKLLYEYVFLFWNCAPSNCWGRPEALETWKGLYPEEPA